MYLDKPMREYLDDLAALRPAPGGGSAAALAAAAGASLMSMVANYTVGNPKYKAVEAKAADILIKSEKFRNELQGLVDKDVEAYSKLVKAMKECSRDAAKMDAAYKAALTPPLDVCRIAADCMKLCAELVEAGNPNLITDTAIAAIMFEGAFFSAKYNVYINLKYIKDMDYIGTIHKMLAPLEETMPKFREEILERCEDVISK